MKELIKKLVEAVGPSGYEDTVRNLVAAEIKDYVDDIKVDALGNLVVRKGKKVGSGNRLMLTAHIDEIGIIATHIDENGFVRFTSVGGVNPLYCVSGRVHFINGTYGVIGSEKTDTPDRVPPLDKMFIDVGASNKETCPVHVGDVAAFDRPFQEIGKRYVSKAMDDRVAAAILIEVIKQIKDTPHELFFVFSVQEEVGLRGATTSAYGVDPEIGISVDVTRTGDTPKGINMEVSLGKGPAIKVRDGGMLSDPRLVRWMINVAEKAGLPYQLEVLEGGTTDARAMQISRAGMPAGCVSVPCRYIHSPSEMVDTSDIQNAVKLLVAMLTQPVELK